MYKRPIRLITSLIISLLATYSLAVETDFSKPIAIDSGEQFIDGKNKKSRFWQNVKITQGSLTIIADEVEVDASEGEGKQIFIARGNPASYSQRMEDGTSVVAKALELRYEVSSRTISLIGQAELQQNTSKVQGESITYDIAAEQLSARGGSDDSDKRVTTVFQPGLIRDLSDKEKEEKDKSEEPPQLQENNK